jgi:tripartite-type tricarboxylate transporter receptor subunit TctC
VFVALTRRAAAGLALALAAAAAQAWPDKPLRLVVPLPPGGQVDMVARVIAPPVAAALGQPVVIENRPGAQGNIGLEGVARAAPDGYTLLFTPTSLVVNPHLYKLRFDAEAFVPVALVARTQFVLVASPALPVNSAAELVPYARAHPEQLGCAHAGGVTQLACALLARLAGARIVPVPYRSNTQAMNDLARGEVQLAFDGAASAFPNWKAGRVKALAATDPGLGVEPFERLAPLAATLPGFELVSWLGIVAPPGTPPERAARVAEAVGAALAEPAVRERLSGAGLHPRFSAPAAFAVFLREEHARYARMAREAGLRPEE